ncbi:toxin-antitoxin system YwqK family antitoxin, partial [uncultured Helicobacter sp.]
TNGNLKSEMNFVDGLQDGEMKIYDTSGLPWHSLQYKDGKKEGIAKEFDEQGKVIREVMYRDDKEIKQ